MSKPGPSEQTLQRAAIALQMGRPQDAEQLAGSVLKSDRGNAGAACVLGQALLAMNRAADAVAPLERAARRSADARVETLLAAAFRATGRTQEALDRLHQAVTRRPPFAPAFAEYCGQLAQAGRIGEAIAVAETGLALMPSVTDIQLAMARLLIMRNDRARARAILLQTQAAAPARTDVLGQLAYAMLLDGEYAAAADLYRRVLALSPDDSASRASLATCLLELGDRSAAVAQLREAVRRRPDVAGRSIIVMSAAARGRLFLRPSAAAKFLQG